MAVSEEMIELDEWRVERIKCLFNKGTGFCENNTSTIKFKCSAYNCPRICEEVKKSCKCGDCINFHGCDKRILVGNTGKVCAGFDI